MQSEMYQPHQNTKESFNFTLKDTILNVHLQLFHCVCTERCCSSLCFSLRACRKLGSWAMSLPGVWHSVHKVLKMCNLLTHTSWLSCGLVSKFCTVWRFQKSPCTRVLWKWTPHWVKLDAFDKKYEQILLDQS